MSIPICGSIYTFSVSYDFVLPHFLVTSEDSPDSTSLRDFSHRVSPHFFYFLLLKPSRQMSGSHFRLIAE
uniref:Ovule protein n=1 Tax=Bursaphelenchus xylophilus TaxID=6326 RepID=A0A1I7RPD4_BURXY